MRIIAGIRKGLKLKAPEGLDTRPTTDRVKESVFNIVQTHFPCESALDLFAGSGALGIEAISRRCTHCTFVEFDKTAAGLVRHNIGLAGFEESAKIVLSDYLAFLDSCKGQFDIIFMDPPYNKGYIAPALDKISKRGLIGEGIIVIETEKDGETAEHPDFKVVRQAIYGKTVITVLKRGDA